LKNTEKDSTIPARKFSVLFSRRAKRFIDGLTEQEKIRIRERVNELAKDPYRAGKRLMGGFKARNVWSSRVGDYRLLYVILDPENTVFVVRVDLRKRVYRPM